MKELIELFVSHLGLEDAEFCKRTAENHVWLIRDTAEYFSLSISTVAEDLQIAKKLVELKNIGSRNKALKKIRGIKI